MEAFEIDKYKEIALRRRWWIIIPFLLSILIGMGYGLKLPKIYQASTLILVQRQKVPTSYVREIVSIDLQDRIRTITQQIKSRTNLEKIIKELDLFNETGKHMFMEDKIESLRERIGVHVHGRGRQGANSFRISFTGKYPNQTAVVANALASYFITENLRLREDHAIGTSEFLTDELENIRRRLLEKEEELKRYRERYMGGLPEQLATNLRILGRIQEQIVRNQDNLREAEERKMLIQEKISVISESQISHVEKDKVLDQLKAQLASLEERYTQRHPDVLHLKRRISDLESKQKRDLEGSQNVPEGDEMSQAEKNLVIKLRKIELEVANLQVELARQRSQAEWYQAQIDNTPKRETELISLNRDYRNIQDTYNSLLSRKLEAEIAVNLERKQKGEQFRILDPAKVPIRPFQPDIQRIFLMSMAIGFALGCGLAYLREIMDTSFRRPGDIEELLQIPVLASLPLSLNAKELKRIKRKGILTALSVGLTFLLAGVVIVFSIKGVDSTINFIKNIFARM